MGGQLKKVFYIAVAVLVLARLIDFVFYGGHAYDLVATVGLPCCFPVRCWRSVRVP